jgi:hypothetical protein
VHDHFGMPMLFALVDVFGRGDRQQADSQAQRARENPRNPHEGIVCDRA